MLLADAIEHTLLSPGARPEEVDAHCDAAADACLLGVCVAPIYVARAAARLDGRCRCLVTVVGFPSGAHRSDVKAFEAQRAAADGATDIDMVMSLGAALAGQWPAVERDILAVRRAAPQLTLKVILETGLLDAETLARAVEVAVAAGVDFVKTSTGFGPRGASVDDVQRMVAAAGGRAEVKAAGGIRSAAAARAMLEAGATRIGTSAGPAIARDEQGVR